MKEKEYNVATICPHCGSEFTSSVKLPADPTALAPAVRSKMRPIGSMFVYRITSDDIRIFIQNKCREISGSEVKVELIPCYCEKKHQSKDYHRAYASLRVALSSNVIEKNSDLGWYGKIGESSDSVRMIPSIFKSIVQKYQYRRETIDNWLGNYKFLEELEERFGMTEEFIKDLRNYCTPRTLKPNNNANEQWIVFAAAPEAIISDMLSPVTSASDKLDKKMDLKINDVRLLSKENVEFIVHLNPDESVLQEDPTVRNLLLGNAKKK